MLDNPENIAEAGNTSSSEETNPYGYPDWRDATQYPSVTTTSIKDWKWEFIRRDPEYIDAWNEYGDHLANEFRDDHIWNEDRLNAKLKFGLDFLLHPNTKKQNPFLRAANNMLNQSYLLPFEENRIDEFCQRAFSNNHILVSIDPSLPDKPQFNAISKQLKDWRIEFASIALDDETTTGESPKPRVRLFPIYLRLLDAKGELSPESKTWNYVISKLNTEEGTAYVSEDTWKKDRYKQARKLLRVVRGWALLDHPFEFESHK